MATNGSDVQSASKFSVEVSPHSHLNFSALKRFNEVVFWERPELPELVPTDRDILSPLVVSNRVDNMATARYGDPVLLWALVLANDVRLPPPLGMQPGFLYRVPRAAEVVRALRERK